MLDMDLGIHTEWRHGILGWVLPGGRFMPVISGGDGSTGSDDEEEEDKDDEEEEIKDPKAALKSANEKADRFAKKSSRLEKKLKDREEEMQAEIDELKEQIESGASDDGKKEIETLKSEVEKQKTVIADKDATIILMDHEEIAGLSKRKRKLAIRMLLDDVEIDKDGETNIDELIEQLKEDEPDLFEVAGSQNGSGDDGDEEDDDEDELEEDGLDAGGVKTKRRTASPPKKKKGSKEIDQATLEKKFPHLARHRPG